MKKAYGDWMEEPNVSVTQARCEVHRDKELQSPQQDRFICKQIMQRSERIFAAPMSRKRLVPWNAKQSDNSQSEAG